MPEGDGLDLRDPEQLADNRRELDRRWTFGPAPAAAEDHGRRRDMRRPSPYFLCTACLLTPKRCAIVVCGRSRITLYAGVTGGKEAAGHRGA